MTQHRHLKQLVRARMDRTGERYTTARRHVLAAAIDLPHLPGIHPETAALRALLTAAGLPLTEEMVLGIGGGIGAGVFAFQYPEVSTFFVAGRHLWQDNVAFLVQTCDRLGVTVDIDETSGKAKAERQLEAALDAGRPVIAWVDAAALPYRGLSQQWEGGGYHVVVVYGAEDDGYRIGDLITDPIVVGEEDLAAARARIGKQRNRLLRITGAPSALDQEPAVRAGLAACAEGLFTGRLRNFTLDAFADWADRLTGRGKDGWARMFPPGPRLWFGLRSITEFVDHYGTGGGLMRPMFARFLAEAELPGLAERYDELGRRWSDLARAALPDDVPLLAQTRELLDERDVRFHADGAAAAVELERISADLDAIGETVRVEFPLDAASAGDLLAGLRDRLLEIVARERAAAAEVMAAARSA